MIRDVSEMDPLGNAEVAHAAAEVVRKAHAVGLIERAPAFAELTYPEVKRALVRVREAGIGGHAGRELERARGDDATLVAAGVSEISCVGWFIVTRPAW